MNDSKAKDDNSTFKRKLLILQVSFLQMRMSSWNKWLEAT